MLPYHHIQVLAAIAAFVVVGINVFLAVNYLSNLSTIGTASLTVAGAAIAIYIVFCAYLFFDMTVHMGSNCAPVLIKYVRLGGYKIKSCVK